MASRDDQRRTATTLPSSLKQRIAAAARTGVFWAVAFYVVSRIALYCNQSMLMSDVGVFLQYAIQGVDYGRTPYSQQGEPSPLLRDFRILEYPPTGYWTFTLPRRLSNWRMPAEPSDPALRRDYFEKLSRHYGRYDWEFRALMLVFDAAAFGLFTAIVRRRKPAYLAGALWSYVLSTTLLGHVLLTRLDIGLLAMLLAWAYCWLRADESPRRAWAWSIASYAALGFGISFKLIPVVIVPFPLWADLLRLRAKPFDGKLLLGPAALVAAALGPFAYYYAQVGDDLWAMFRFHSVRGVQIESSYATAMMLLTSAAELTCRFDYGSWNLGGPLEPAMTGVSSWLLLAVLLIFGVRALAAPLVGERFDRVAAYRWACVTVPVATLLAKVLSPQYLVWAVPMLILAAVEFFPSRAFRPAAAACIAVSMLTAFIFPFHYLRDARAWPYSADRPPPFALIENPRTADVDGAPRRIGDFSTGLPRTAIIARNLLLAALCIAVTTQATRRRPKESARET